MESQFSRVLLEPEQEELFTFIVEAARSVSREKREKFIVIQIADANLALLIHPGINNREIEVYSGDIKEIGTQGLIAIEYSSGGTLTFDITSFGFKYYEYLKTKKGEAVERVEVTVRDYINSSIFKTKYPDAFNKWSSAETLLWQKDSPQQLTSIGHHCREAVQAFVDALIELYQPPNVIKDKTKTKNRLRAVFDLKAKQLGEKRKEFVEALLEYWDALEGLIQRQEHGAYKDGEQLSLEDARRVVFQTMVLIFEIDKVLS
jgi:hypothetical protein